MNYSGLLNTLVLYNDHIMDQSHYTIDQSHHTIDQSHDIQSMTGFVSNYNKVAR